MSLDELEANSSILIIAGSETTATVLAGVTYLLLKNPDKMKKLVEEVRTMFASEEEIDLTSVNRLTYMLACLDEALRMYPPVPTGLPREVPKGGGDNLRAVHPRECELSTAIERSGIVAKMKRRFAAGCSLTSLHRLSLRFTSGPPTTTRETSRTRSSSIRSAFWETRSMRRTRGRRCSRSTWGLGIALDESESLYPLLAAVPRLLSIAWYLSEGRDQPEANRDQLGLRRDENHAGEDDLEL